MSLINKMLGKHLAKDYFFISYTYGGAGICCVALKAQDGRYLDLSNNIYVEKAQVEFQRIFVDYVDEIVPEELISKRKVKELAKTKLAEFSKDSRPFIRKENEGVEKGTILSIHVQ